MDDIQYDQSILIQTPFFDFYDAIENYGFNFEEFKANGFSDFVQRTYSVIFIKLRKSYIQRNIVEFRNTVHTLKGVFA